MIATSIIKLDFGDNDFTNQFTIIGKILLQKLEYLTYTPTMISNLIKSLISNIEIWESDEDLKQFYGDDFIKYLFSDSNKRYMISLIKPSKIKFLKTYKPKNEDCEVLYIIPFVDVCFIQ